jgi:competence ComEA-like helix-hairpin-helix protein
MKALPPAILIYTRRTNGLKLLLLILGTAIFITCRADGGSTTNVNSTPLPKTRETESTIERQVKASCLNINAASSDELVSLPGIGEVMAKRIIEYRTLQGRFRRPEELIIVEGFSERKYRAIEGMICVE